MKGTSPHKKKLCSYLFPCHGPSPRHNQLIPHIPPSHQFSSSPHHSSALPVHPPPIGLLLRAPQHRLNILLVFLTGGGQGSDSPQEAFATRSNDDNFELRGPS